MNDAKKIKCFNRVEICGYVTNFEIKTFSTGTRLANIAIKDELTGNLTYAQMFDRERFVFDGKDVTLDGLGKIFMDASGKPRNVLVTAIGKVRETQVAGKDGETKTYTNTTLFSIEASNDPAKQRAILKLTGIIEGVRFSEDEDGNSVAKMKLGMLNYNKDKDINGIDYVTVVARDKAATKLEDLDAEKGCYTNIQCDMLNVLGETDRFGNRIGTSKKEIAVANVLWVNDADDLDEVDVKNYAKAKKLGKGEVIKVNAGAELKTDSLPSGWDDDSLDF